MNYIKLYTSSSAANSVYFLSQGSVYFYTSNVDKYAINGKNLIIGSTEILMKHLLKTDTNRLETAVTDKNSIVKKMSVDKFLSGMKQFSFALNVSMVLAKQVLLTNQIINKNMDLLSGDERKVRDLSIEYFSIVDRLKNEYEKRKIPWIKDLYSSYLTSLTYKRGEAFSRSSDPVKLTATANISDKDVEYARGSVICEENTVGEEMYILKSGAIDVMIKGSRVATIVDSETIIGEMALLLGEKRTATLVAKNNVVITRIRKEDLKDIARKDVDLFMGVAVSLAKRHYYNIVKIESINKSLIERAIDEEEGAAKTSQAPRIMKDLKTLKTKVEDTMRGKDAGFLQDLVDNF